jgi:hypothetical protein
MATLADSVLLWLHARRLGFIGDGQGGKSSVLVLDGVAVGATRAPATFPLIGTGLSAAGAVTLTGAVVGDVVSKVYDQNAANWVDVTADFEATISVANQIQETVSVSGHQIIVFLTPGS